MFRNGPLLALYAGAVTLALLGEVRAQAAAERQVYQPSLGDLMTMAIQPRHIKLGLAAREKNWAYAAYELRELQSAFQRVARTVPVYKSTDMAGLIIATTSAPMEDVAAAIKAGDSGKFDEAYAQLTETCNACHQSTATK
ncbi:MAG: cytochrome family protein, partial [Alphaproteobacteria bacterium]|nr:cytochrome family protein [Alphaproteobacteria bacterium]